jgi:carbamate kinase
MLVVIALGGNALQQRGQLLEAEILRRNICMAASAIAAIVQSHTVVVTHGNGPQVGLLALQSEAYTRVSPYPLDVLGAETEGMIGYLIEQELRNCLPNQQVATLLTQVEVDPHDPAFAQPTKPIGPFYTQTEAELVARERGWTILPERGYANTADGKVYRRVVPSPRPQRILELPTIRLLVERGVLVICVGGGGIPVTLSPDRRIHGVEAVIDKDWASALLATGLAADVLLLLTDVDAVYRGWETDQAEPLPRTTPDQLAQYAFASGSMGPKVEAACHFVRVSGGYAGIGRLDDAPAILNRQRGTIIEL